MASFIIVILMNIYWMIMKTDVILDLYLFRERGAYGILVSIVVWIYNLWGIGNLLYYLKVFQYGK